MDILLFTSGLDSFLANWALERRKAKFRRVYFDLRGVYNKHELSFLHSLYSGEYFNVEKCLEIGQFENVYTAHVPNRNLLLVTLAHSIYSPDHIWINGVKDDRVSDNDGPFYEMASKLLYKTRKNPISVGSPLSRKEKATWCQEYANAVEKPGEGDNNKYELLTATYSCFSSSWYIQDLPIYKYLGEGNYEIVGKMPVAGCLKCPACYRRLCALTHANIFVPFDNLPLAFEYVNKINETIHPARKFSAMRYSEFLNQFLGGGV